MSKDLQLAIEVINESTDSNSLSELKSIIDERLGQLKDNEILSFAKQADEIASRYGLEKDELLNTVSNIKKSVGKSKGGNIEPKYRHLTNLSLVWSGRGKQPNWIKEWLENNPENTIDDLLIKKH